MTAPTTSEVALIAKVLAITAMLLLAGCDDPHSPQQRRERMVADCTAEGHPPIECAEAARETIP